MERKTKLKYIICLSLFFTLSAVLLVSLAFSSKIETALGLKTGKNGALDKYDFKIDFIDVGQGASCLINLPTGENVLIDAGTNKSEKQLERYLKKRDISLIDYFIITHSDNDHTGGADMVLENFEVKEIYRPFILSSNSTYLEDNDPLLFYKDILDEVTIVDGVDYAKCIDLMYKETYTENGKTIKSTVQVASEKSVISAQTALVQFWWPQVEENAEEIYHEKVDDKNVTLGYPTIKCSTVNNYSPVITIDYLSVSIVLTGDASSVVERAVMKNARAKEALQNCDIYAAGHHGSNSSSCEEFLNLLMPKYVVVQCGESSTHPHPKFLERVQSVYKSAGKSGEILQSNKNGDIEFYFASVDGKVKSAVSYSGSSTSIVTAWWQVVVTTIAVLAVFLLLPLIPRPNKKYKRRK